MRKKLFLLTVLGVVITVFVVGCVAQNDAQNLFNEGAKLFQEGKYDDAIQKYEEGLKKDTNNAIGYNLLGMAHRFKFNQVGAQQYKDKEIESFKKAIELEPNYLVAYKNLAASLYYQGRKKEAVPYLERALELQPNDPERELILQWIAEGKKQTGITLEQAKEIGKKELRRRNYSYIDEDLRVEADEGNTAWQEYATATSDLLQRLNLKGRNYWAIYYARKKLMPGGDAWVFVDNSDGEIIGVMFGE